MIWREVEPGSDFFVLEYQAKGYARTNCCAFRVNEGFVVLSPAPEITDQHISFLQATGPILALIPPHAGHTLGLRFWKDRLPRVPIYAAPGSLERISKVTKMEVNPISEFIYRDPAVRIYLAPGFRDAALFVNYERGGRPIAYVDEILEDLDRVPGPMFLKPLFYLLGKRPGFQVNRGVIRFYVEDKQALTSEVLQILQRGPHMVFAHGPVRSTPADLGRVRKLLESV